MVKSADREYAPLPPPTASDTHDNLQTKRPRVSQSKNRQRRDGRTEYLEVFATPELARMVKARAAEKKWTVSGTIENACADAKDAARMLRESCPECRKAKGKG